MSFSSPSVAEGVHLGRPGIFGKPPRSAPSATAPDKAMSLALVYALLVLGERRENDRGEAHAEGAELVAAVAFAHRGFVAVEREAVHAGHQTAAGDLEQRRGLRDLPRSTQASPPLPPNDIT
jgi:hypothetical protein